MGDLKKESGLSDQTFITCGLLCIGILIIITWYMSNSNDCPCIQRRTHMPMMPMMRMMHKPQYSLNTFKVPNSNTSVRHLNDENAYKSETMEDRDIDTTQEFMHMEKYKNRTAKVPRSNTSSRSLVDNHK